VPGHVHVRVVPPGRLVLDVRDVDRDPARALLRGAVDALEGDVAVRGPALCGEYLGDGGVRVVLPWSTCPIVPMLRCGFVRAYDVLVMAFPGSAGRPCGPCCGLGGSALRGSAPQDRRHTRRRAWPVGRTLPPGSWVRLRGEGQRRAPASRDAADAAEPGRLSPAGTSGASVQNMAPPCQPVGPAVTGFSRACRRRAEPVGPSC
jgi:hypothetical protein